MDRCSEFLSTPELDYEGWKDLVRSICGRYTPAGVEPKTFAGRVRARNICGFVAVDISSNACQIERTQRDTRLDARDHYYAIFQIAGQSTMIQNDRAVLLDMGNVALVDAARPVTYVSEKRGGQWLTVQLPRRSIVSHLGAEPPCGFCRRDGAIGARLLCQLVLGGAEDEQSMSARARVHMRLTFFDLLGALFGSFDPAPASAHADKLFSRICGIIEDHFANPEFGPCEVATEARISLRYLQKLFTARNSTCSGYIHSVRLAHAARLLHRRELLNTRLPLSEIAYACGYRDYTHFVRKFRCHFGAAPGAHCKGYVNAPAT
jgi:AraC family transcriptional activator of tynA and feaB